MHAPYSPSPKPSLTFAGTPRHVSAERSRLGRVYWPATTVAVGESAGLRVPMTTAGLPPTIA